MARDPVCKMEAMNQKQVEERKRIEERMSVINQFLDDVQWGELDYLIVFKKDWGRDEAR